MELLTVAVIVAVLYVAYINRDKIKAKIESVLDKDDGLDEEPVSKPATIVTNPATPISGTTAPNSGTYSGVGEPPNQEAWAAWLATLDPMTRSYYPAIWKPTPTQPSGSGDTVPTFSPVSGNLVSDQVMKRGVRFISTGSLGIIQAFALEPGASRVTVSETSGTGDKVQYNLWISDSPAGVARDGVPNHAFQYNTATVIFTPSEKTLYANVRALVDGGRPFYIQAN